MIWTIIYAAGGARMPITVEAPDLERAKMRAGMARSALMCAPRVAGFASFRRTRWQISRIECDGEVVFDEGHPATP